MNHLRDNFLYHTHPNILYNNQVLFKEIKYLCQNHEFRISKSITGMNQHISHLKPCSQKDNEKRIITAM